MSYKSYGAVTLCLICTLLSSCDKVKDYANQYFFSEKQPEKIKENIGSLPINNSSDSRSSTHPLIQYHPRRGVESLQKEFTYFLRGNNTSLLKAQSLPGKYVLTLHGVGEDMIFLSNGNKADKVGYITLDDFLSHWNSKKIKLESTLILLRNESDGSQKDIALYITLSDPKYDSMKKELSFLLTPESDFKTDYVSADLGATILLFDVE